jgi:hypothetical protein
MTALTCERREDDCNLITVRAVNKMNWRLGLSATYNDEDDVVASHIGYYLLLVGLSCQ